MNPCPNILDPCSTGVSSLVLYSLYSSRKASCWNCEGLITLIHESIREVWCWITIKGDSILSPKHWIEFHHYRECSLSALRPSAGGLHHDSVDLLIKANSSNAANIVTFCDECNLHCSSLKFLSIMGTFHVTYVHQLAYCVHSIFQHCSVEHK